MGDKNRAQAIAGARIAILFDEAQKSFSKGNEKRARQYVELALRVSARNKAPLDASQKQRFCRKCRAFLQVGKNAKKRVHKDYCTLSCDACGHVTKRRLKSPKTRGK